MSPSRDSAADRSERKAHLPLRELPRLAHIVRVLAAQGLVHYLERLRLKIHVPEGAPPAGAVSGPEARRFRLALEELGPSFVKFGQMLSVRQDLFPEEVIAELATLQDRVPPFPSEQARALIERELGRALGELYAAFEERPLAAASIAQVHVARLLDGTAVIVKVQRPDIEALLRADIELLYFLARLLERHVPESRRFDPLGLVTEFAETVARELDFHMEASNAERFQRNLAGKPSVYVPHVYWELTTRRVLTMARSPGRRLGADYPEDAAERRRVAQALAQLTLTQLFEHGFFHGDLHPGNMFLLPDGRLCFHDFGIVGRLAPRDQEHLRGLCVALVLRDAEWMADLYIEMGVAPETVDRAAFIRDLEEALERYYAIAGREYSFAEILRQFIRLAGRYEIRTPRELLLVAKVFMQLESLARELDPTFNMLAMLEAYVPRLILRDLRPEVDGPAAVGRAYRGLTALRAGLRGLPQGLERLGRQLARGEVRLHLRHERIEDLQAHIDRASNRLAFSLIIAAIVIGSSIVTTFHAGPHYGEIPLIGLAGFVIAAVLGLAWALATMRSGRF
ncbi:ubiquinone biosynthesis protein UbiB [Sulfurifustis variabilis]|uniref:Ubiquinone biosynthesis protein UbiB n=1 Tax=Sulfurifustis variabilis TaxID=1675686 RepID=A0A1C7AF22_9GAMM|nr:AarF/ABC1/UbiB kinase family protein [Sulfurifustis variabilis]BAU49822.1 ubiquinone biosynthesis protein UbiB [Sulfurifustis variabilis]